ncbi:histone-lysine N-methyltransferase SETMAR [Trichonephila clavipes]|nr:histone-lysine N-methyltransferase SETMAR [Trichonephila clavipes]
MMDRISICEALAKRNEIDPFLKRRVTEDEKWVTYYNIVQKMIVIKKLLPHGETLNSDIYCQQLNCLKLAIDQKWPELVNRRDAVFHQDNARPHTSVVTRQNLWELGWEGLMRPPYSPDLAPSDYPFFLNWRKLLE